MFILEFFFSLCLVARVLCSAQSFVHLRAMSFDCVTFSKRLDRASHVCWLRIAFACIYAYIFFLLLIFLMMSSHLRRLDLHMLFLICIYYLYSLIDNWICYWYPYFCYVTTSKQRIMICCVHYVMVWFSMLLFLFFHFSIVLFRYFKK